MTDSIRIERKEGLEPLELQYIRDVIEETLAILSMDITEAIVRIIISNEERIACRYKGMEREKEYSKATQKDSELIALKIDEMLWIRLKLLQTFPQELERVLSPLYNPDINADS
jgi:hypothetical protein